MPASPTASAATDAHPGARALRRLIHRVFVVLVDAVPVVGILYYDWSVAACLIVFWCENLVSGLTMVARMLAHRALTHHADYTMKRNAMTVNGKPVPLGYVAAYAVGTFGFTLAAGIFVFFFVYLLGGLPASQPAEWGMDSAQLSLLKGIGAMVCFQTLDFLHDLVGIRRWPFAWIQTLAERQLNRVVVLHLGIIFGGFAIVFAQAGSVMPVFVAATLIKMAVDLVAERRG